MLRARVRCAVHSAVYAPDMALVVAPAYKLLVDRDSKVVAAAEEAIIALVQVTHHPSCFPDIHKQLTRPPRAARFRSL